MESSTSESPVAQTILDTCFEAFNELGYKGVSMDSIAKKLRVSKKTIYKLHSSKEEILEKCILRNTGFLEQKSIDILSQPASLEVLLGMAELYREFLGQFAKHLRVEIKNDVPHLENLTDIFLKDGLKKNIAGIFKELRKSGQIKYQVTTKEITEGFFLMVRGVNTLPMVNFREIITAFLHGLKVDARAEVGTQEATSKKKRSKSKKKKQK